MQAYKQTLLTLSFFFGSIAMILFFLMIDIIDYGEIRWPFKLLYWILGE